MSLTLDDFVDHTIYKGADTPISAQAYEYRLAGNGLFKRAKGLHFSAQIQLARHNVVGLPPLQQEIHLTHGRIPGRMLQILYNDALTYARRGLEQAYVFVMEKGGLRLTRLKQTASGSTVHYDGADFSNVICKLHSHHKMDAFFSETDNADDLGFCFYAVIGYVIGQLTSKPEILVRLGMHGDLVHLPASLLFDDLGPFEDCYQRGRGQ